MSRPSIRETIEELQSLLNDVREWAHPSPSYGTCHGDPRNFFPDPECSTEEERALHKADCERAERGEHPTTQTRCYGVVTDDASLLVMPSGYGLGTNQEPEDETYADIEDRLERAIDHLIHAEDE